MQYELQKLERMTLDQVREIAVGMGLTPRRNQSIREISYAILDAQADNRAAVVQAKEEARAAAGLPAKRERTRGVKRAATKVNTANLKSEHVMATVGTEKEQLAQMQEQIEANNHKPNRTVQQAGGILGEAPEETVSVQPTVAEAPAPEPKKRGRKKKTEQPELPLNEMPETVTDIPEQPQETPAPVNETQETLVEGAEEVVEESADFVMPNLGENVIAMGTLECAPDGYGFLRSADYNYLPSPDDIYVSKEQMRQYGLKPGDTIECSIRVNPQPDKFFPMDKVIRINGLAPELAKQRIAFENLTPLFPDQKFKLCTGHNDSLSVRMIDLFAPIGKGQR
jgi:transcription termination factor Rho